MSLWNWPDAVLDLRLMESKRILRRRTGRLNLCSHPSSALSAPDCRSDSELSPQFHLFHKREVCFSECQEIRDCDAKPAGYCTHATAYQQRRKQQLDCCVPPHLSLLVHSLTEQAAAGRSGSRAGQFLLTVCSCCLCVSVTHLCKSSGERHRYTIPRVRWWIHVDKPVWLHPSVLHAAARPHEHKTLMNVRNDVCGRRQIYPTRAKQPEGELPDI